MLRGEGETQVVQQLALEAGKAVAGEPPHGAGVAQNVEVAEQQVEQRVVDGGGTVVAAVAVYDEQDDAGDEDARVDNEDGAAAAAVLGHEAGDGQVQGGDGGDNDVVADALLLVGEGVGGVAGRVQEGPVHAEQHDVVVVDVDHVGGLGAAGAEGVGVGPAQLREEGGAPGGQVAVEGGEAGVLARDGVLEHKDAVHAALGQHDEPDDAGERVGHVDDVLVLEVEVGDPVEVRHAAAVLERAVVDVQHGRPAQNHADEVVDDEAAPVDAALEEQRQPVDAALAAGEVGRQVEAHVEAEPQPDPAQQPARAVAPAVHVVEPQQQERLQRRHRGGFQLCPQQLPCLGVEPLRDGLRPGTGLCLRRRRLGLAGGLVRRRKKRPDGAHRVDKLGRAVRLLAARPRVVEVDEKGLPRHKHVDVRVQPLEEALDVADHRGVLVERLQRHRRHGLRALLGLPLAQRRRGAVEDRRGPVRLRTHRARADSLERLRPRVLSCGLGGAVRSSVHAGGGTAGAPATQHTPSRPLPRQTLDVRLQLRNPPPQVLQLVCRRPQRPPVTRRHTLLPGPRAACARHPPVRVALHLPRLAVPTRLGHPCCSRSSCGASARSPGHVTRPQRPRFHPFRLPTVHRSVAVLSAVFVIHSTSLLCCPQSPPPPCTRSLPRLPQLPSYLQHHTAQNMSTSSAPLSTPVHHSCASRADRPKMPRHTRSSPSLSFPPRFAGCLAFAALTAAAQHTHTVLAPASVSQFPFSTCLLLLSCFSFWKCRHSCGRGPCAPSFGRHSLLLPYNHTHPSLARFRHLASKTGGRYTESQVAISTQTQIHQQISRSADRETATTTTTTTTAPTTATTTTASSAPTGI